MSTGATIHTAAPSVTDAAPLMAFFLVVAATLLLCLLFGADSEGIDDLYAAGRSVRPWRNALAMTGDTITISLLLSCTGLVSVAGYDGTALAVSTIGAYVVLQVLARPLRNTGRFTIGDTLAARFDTRSVRTAAAVICVVVCVPLCVVQLTAAGGASAAMLGLSGTAPAQLCTVFIGGMMVCAAALTGMRGNTLLQVVKTLMVFVCLVALVILLLRSTGWSPVRLLSDAIDRNAGPVGYFAPGRLYGTDLTGRLNLLSVQVTVVLGSAVVPHMIMRVKTAEHGGAARRSIMLATGMVTVFALLAVALGLGAAARSGAQAVGQFDLQSSTAILSLVQDLVAGPAGDLLTALVVSAVFLTSLTVVAALALSAGAALVHDIYVSGLHRGRVLPSTEIKAMRWATPVIGAIAVLLSLLAQNWHIQFLAQFAVSVSASAVLPSLVYALFWKGCTKTGLLWAMYTGLACCVVLQMFGPMVSGRPGALFPSVDFAWFPLATTGLVTIPVGFAAGWIASVRTARSREPDHTARYAAIAARSLLDRPREDRVL
ncbi:cation acetate symporter [Streptomyces longwoodensis]|uniref:sodium:solute symporter family transporter n=1 Tax=Streptomyces longwoodensis TaxID=68231 RepID=UPI00340D890D